MAVRANPRIIGAFVLGAVVIVVVGILVFGSGEFLKKKRAFVLFFEGSIGGLNVGSPVNLRGVQVGSVTDIVLRLGTANQEVLIPVYIEFDPAKIEGAVPADKPMKNFDKVIKELGLRAQLQTQSFLTGLQSIELDFHPDTPIRLVGADDRYLEIPTIPSTVQKLQKTIEATLGDLAELPLEELFAHLLTTVDAAGATLISVQTVVEDLDSQIAPLISSLIETSEQARLTLAEADARLEMREGEVMYTVNKTLEDARGLVRRVDQQVDPLAANAIDAMGSAVDALNVATATLGSVNTVLADAPEMAYVIKNALGELGSAITSIRILAEYLQQNPNALLYGKSESLR